jgi:hypothetical protein
VIRDPARQSRRDEDLRRVSHSGAPRDFIACQSASHGAAIVIRSKDGTDFGMTGTPFNRLTLIGEPGEKLLFLAHS